MEAFVGLIVCFLSLIGLVSLIHTVIYAIFKFDLSNKSAMIVFLDNETHEITIRAAAEISKWKKGAPTNLIALDNGLSKNAKREAKFLLNDYNIELYNEDELLDKLRNLRNESRTFKRYS